MNHKQMVDFAIKYLIEEKGFEKNQIKTEQRIYINKQKFFTIDVIAINKNQRIAIECGKLRQPRIQRVRIIREYFDEFIHIPYGIRTEQYIEKFDSRRRRLTRMRPSTLGVIISLLKYDYLDSLYELKEYIFGHQGEHANNEINNALELKVIKKEGNIIEIDKKKILELLQKNGIISNIDKAEKVLVKLTK